MKIFLKSEYNSCLPANSPVSASCPYCLTAEHYFYSLLPFSSFHPLFKLLVPSFLFLPFLHFYIYKMLPTLLFPSSSSLLFSSISCHLSFLFSFSSSSMPGLMHSHHPFIHNVLFIKAGIIQPTPRHLSLLRPTSHPLPPSSTSTHGTSLKANALPVACLFSFLLSCLCRSHSRSLF